MKLHVLVLLIFASLSGSGIAAGNGLGYVSIDSTTMRLRIGPYSSAQLESAGDSGWVTPEIALSKKIETGEELWVRMLLPVGNWKRPVLYLKANLQNLQVFQGNKLLYQNNQPGAQKDRITQKIIALDTVLVGQHLYLRATIINPFYVGELRAIYVGEADSLMSLRDREELADGTISIRDGIIGGVLFFVGIFSLFVFFVRFDLRLFPFLVFSIISISLGISYLMAPFSTYSIFGLGYMQGLYINVVSLFILSPVFTYFLEMILGAGWKKLMRRLWQVSAVYSLVFISILIFDAPSTHLLPDVGLVILIEAVLMLMVMIISGFHRRRDVRYLTYAITVFLLLAIYDLLRPEVDASLSGYGVLLISFALAHILIRYYDRITDEHRKTQEMVKQQEMELEAVKAEALRSQFEALKSQVNPHFLFNSFSTLLSLIEENSSESGKFVQMLANVYRYVLACQDKSLVTIAEELEFVHAFVFLLQHRFENALTVHIEIPDAVRQKHIIPLAMQILLENTVKHNIISDKKPMEISITYNEQEKSISVVNSLQKKKTIPHSTKIGLQNVIRRYQFFTTTPIIIQETETQFRVTLPVLES